MVPNEVTRREFARSAAVATAGAALALSANRMAVADDQNTLGEPVVLENDFYRIAVDRNHGAISSFFIKGMNYDLVSEPRLADNFRIGLPLPDYQANYIEGMQQSPRSVERSDDRIVVRFDGMKSDRGEFPVELTYTIALDDDSVRFRAQTGQSSRAAGCGVLVPASRRLDEVRRRSHGRAGHPLPTSTAKHDYSIFK